MREKSKTMSRNYKETVVTYAIVLDGLERVSDAFAHQFPTGTHLDVGADSSRGG
jgi:hypothetical protein